LLEGDYYHYSNRQQITKLNIIGSIESGLNRPMPEVKVDYDQELAKIPTEVYHQVWQENFPRTNDYLSFESWYKDPATEKNYGFGQYLALLSVDDKKIKGILGIVDEIRLESSSAVKELHNLKIKTAILTGDNASTALYVAKEVGIDEVHAKLLPDEKVIQLKNLVKKYKDVAMVGDGVNDAPSLSTASVGIAMGAIGSEVAVENADIALMNNNLGLIPFLVKLGRISGSTIRINTSAAIAVKAIFLLLALVGKSSLALAIFADVGVTVLVVANSLRLFNFGYRKN
jgi:cation transport ATPase